MRTYLLYILFALTSLLSCQTENGDVNNDEDPIDPIADTSGILGLPDLSVYHLPGTWNTQDNAQISLADLKGDIVVLVMIYTSCPYACPRLVEDVKGIEAKLTELELKQVNLVLVSIDPEADTPEMLKAFAKEKELDAEHWTLLQGTPSSVLELAAVLGVKYKKTTPVDFSHSNIISVFNKAGELVHQEEGLGADHTATVQTIKAML